MKVLMITGDKTFGPLGHSSATGEAGHPRFELQKSAVEELRVVYWGRGELFPKMPAGPWDVVTAQDPFWRGLFAWHVARRLRTRLNVQVHADLAGQSLTKRALARLVLRRADSVRVVSEKIKQQVLRAAPRARVSVLPIYIDVEKFRRVARQSHPNKTILWLGRFEPEKDPLLALEIFRQVRAQDIGAAMIMLGQGSLRDELKRVAARLNLAAVVEMPGWQEPAPFLARADVVLCTSRHESFGASIVEALAAGVPTVAPEVGVAREAGAVVVPRAQLAQAVADTLTKGGHGELRLHLLDAAQWAKEWRASL